MYSALSTVLKLARIGISGKRNLFMTIRS